ncbi:MAG: hypothetical protein LUF30_12105 [Lachnospiraceae bacterium]|nr:hypothetical protein [Lachnospiraceae bacterium]
MGHKIALLRKYSENYELGIFPDEYFDIPGVEYYQDISSVYHFTYAQLQPYCENEVDLYVNGGMAIELLTVIQVSAVLDIRLTVYHRDSQSGDFYAQTVTWHPISQMRKKLADADIQTQVESELEPELSLCGGRHFGMAKDVIFEQVSTERIFHFHWQEVCAERVLTPFSGKNVRIYLTGLKPLVISVLNVAGRLGIGVTWLHYDCDREEYFEQRMG